MRIGRLVGSWLPLALVLACSSTPSRAPMFGLEASVDGYEISVTELEDRGGQAIDVRLSTESGSAVTVESDVVHIFMVDPTLDRIDHEVLAIDTSGRVQLTTWLDVGDFGPSHVVAWFEDAKGDVVVGTDIDVAEASDYTSGFEALTDDDVLNSSGVQVERDGFDFTLSVPWGGDAADPNPAWLTLVRRSDLALSFDTAELVGDSIFRFDPSVPGSGEYIAVLEFVPGASHDTEHQRLGEGGESGSRFAFSVSVGADGRIVETP